MTKELKAKDLQANFINCFNELLKKTDKNIIVVNISREMAQDMVNLYEEYLTPKPSEALRCLDNLYEEAHLYEDFDGATCDGYKSTIKQALLKSQEQEKALKVIWLKKVDLWRLYFSKTLEDYNTYIMKTGGFTLTEEEFDLLKRWVECQKD